MALRLEPSSELTFDDTPQIPARTSLKLTNDCETRKLAYKIKVTNVKMFTVKPNSGILECGGSETVIIILKPQTESGAAASAKFLVMTTALDAGVHEFTDEKWNQLRPADKHHVKLQVTLVKRPEQVLTVTASLEARLLSVEAVDLSGSTVARLTLRADARLATLRQEISKQVGNHRRYRLITVDGQLLEKSPDDCIAAQLLGNSISLGAIVQENGAVLGSHIRKWHELTLLDVQGLTLQGHIAFNCSPGVSCTTELKLTNTRMERNIAYKVKTTQPKSFLVRPNGGIVGCGGTTTVHITLVSPEEVLRSGKFVIMAAEVDREVCNSLTLEQWSCLDVGEIQQATLKAVMNDNRSGDQEQIGHMVKPKLVTKNVFGNTKSALTVFALVLLVIALLLAWARGS